MEVSQQDKTVTVSLTISDAFCESVMTTAIESGYSGIEYFASVEDVKREKVNDPKETLDWRYVSFRAQEDDSHTGNPDERVSHVITYSEIRKGLALAMAASSTRMRNYARAIVEDDPGQLDANDADIIVQYAMFGDVIYG